MCTKSLSEQDELDDLDRQYRRFRILLGLFGFLAVCLLLAGLSTDRWVVYYSVSDEMEEDNFTMNANTGLWRSCLSSNSTDTRCHSILDHEFSQIPDFFAGLIMVCGGTSFVIIAELLVLCHIRSPAKCVLVAAAIIFFLAGVGGMIGCMFLWFSFSFVIPWYPDGRTILSDFEPSIDWSFLLTTVGALYSTVYGLFLRLAMKLANRKFFDDADDSLFLD